MPCLIIKTNKKLSQEEKQDYCLSASAKTAKILAKPETYVMTLIEDDVAMSFSGNTEPACYLELKSINLPEDETTTLSGHLCQHIGDLLDVPAHRIYIEFSNAQRHLWGWDSKTF